MLNLKILFFGEKRLGQNVDPKKYRIIPTALIVLVLTVAVLSLLYEVYIWMSVSSLAVIEVGGTSYYKGETEYELGMARLKAILTGLLAISSAVALIFTAWLFVRLRKRNQ